MSIRIAGTGSYVPDRVMTNADLEKMVETSDEWIRTRTGIQERRIAAPEQATSDLAYEAGKRALEMAGITGDQLSVIIVATITPDHVFPSTGASCRNASALPMRSASIWKPPAPVCSIRSKSAIR